MSFIPKTRRDLLLEAKNGLFVLAMVGYALILPGGISPDLSVFRSPTYCWFAAGFALIALIFAPKARRWIGIAALIIAVGEAFYSYHENARWKEKLERYQAKHPPVNQIQNTTNATKP